ncbi:MAG: TIGR02710 family CRISPR-associated protein [Candidatus Diapherotrites archaeon]|nr:TIGR02710 family CRISPR-associated protein [Candidatus Diapherotrites archaeon]
MDLKERLKQAWREYKERLASGEEADKAKADSLYREMVWPLLLEKWRDEPEIQTWGDIGNVEVSIHTLGNSPEALILAALGLKAKKVVVLYTDHTEKYLDQIERDLGRKIESHRVSKGDPSDIYRAAKRIIDKYSGPIAFDITSGTKAMTAGLASVGFFIKAKAREIEVDVYYVDNNKYDSALRRPVPGSEFLVRLPSPYVAFGELEEERALVLYRNRAFKDAELVFRRMHGELRDGKYQNLAELAHTYARWAALDFKGAEKSLYSLVSFLKSDAAYGDSLRSALPVLDEQLRGLGQLIELVENCEGGRRKSTGCLELLADPDRVGWLARTLLERAEYYYKLEDYNLSALHYYRALELSLQHRLSLKGINPHIFEPDKLGKDVLTRMQAELENAIGESANMPGRGWGLTLLNIASLLIALEDDTVLPLKNDMRKLHGILDARNESLLIHGLSSASKPNVKSLKNFAEKLIDQAFPELPVSAVELKA